MINLRINHKRITEFSVSLGLFVIIVMLMVSGSVATSIVYADKSSSISTSSSFSTSTNTIIVHPPSIIHNGNSLVIHPAYVSFKANNHHHHYSSHSKSTSSSSCNCPKLSNITKTTTTTTVIQNITNIRGPVKVNFVNSYWTYNTAQDQFVAGTTSARTSAANISPVIKQEVGPGEGLYLR
jgi:hypothetical protein